MPGPLPYLKKKDGVCLQLFKRVARVQVSNHLIICSCLIASSLPLGILVFGMEIWRSYCIQFHNDFCFSIIITLIISVTPY